MICAVVVVFAALVWSGQPTYSQGRSGEIYIDLVSGGFIIGGAGGSGVLVYRGRRYPLSIGGVSIGATIGLAGSRLSGRVYNLRRVTDIEGTYRATGVGYAVVAGHRVARLVNARGVVLHLSGRQVGLEATADVSGIRISLR
jgi:lipid-binding SYLF domain-containing protein